MATKKPRKGRPPVIEALVARVEKQFKPIELPDPSEHHMTKDAQARLNAAASSVNNVLLTMYLSRAIDRGVQKKDPRGRLSETQVDTLRAVIAFAGAGLDAALKKLIRDTVREVALQSKPARRKLVDFIDRYMAGSESPINRRRLAEVLLDKRGSKEALLERYERHLTGDSLQSVGQVSVVCGALGIADRGTRERLRASSALDLMFRARNDIVHQLDLTDIGRKPRKLPEVRRLATEALAVAQEIINEVGQVLSQD